MQKELVVRGTYKNFNMEHKDLEERTVGGSMGGEKENCFRNFSCIGNWQG